MICVARKARRVSSKLWHGRKDDEIWASGTPSCQARFGRRRQESLKKASIRDSEKSKYCSSGDRPNPGEPNVAAPRAARAHRVTAHDSVRQFSSADSSGVLTHRTGHRAGHRTGPPHGTAARAALVCAHRLTRHSHRDPRLTSQPTQARAQGPATG
jgi:hypothetical protein